MKTLKHWSIFTAVTAAMATAFYFWHFKGYAGAGNLLGVYLWLGVTVKLIVAIGYSSFDTEPKPLLRFSRPAHAIRTTIMSCFCAWFGHFALGTMVMLSTVFLYSAIETSRKRHVATKPANA